MNLQISKVNVSHLNYDCLGRLNTPTLYSVLQYLFISETQLMGFLFVYIQSEMVNWVIIWMSQDT